MSRYGVTNVMSDKTKKQILEPVLYKKLPAFHKKYVAFHKKLQ